MKQDKKHPQKKLREKSSRQPRKKHTRVTGSRKEVDKQLAFEIEIAIYEVDKIFEGQGDKLKDTYVVDSLTSFVKVIKDNTFGGYSETLRDGSDEESDMMHINIVNRINSAVEELELEITDAEVTETVKQVLARAKKACSAKSPRAYLDPLAKRLKEMGFRSEFLTDADMDGETIRLEDLENLDDLSLDDDDDLDLNDFRTGY